MAIEEPRYEVLASTDDYEVRRYEAYMIAETDVEGTYKTSGNEAFRILAGSGAYSSSPPRLGNDRERETVKLLPPLLPPQRS